MTTTRVSGWMKGLAVCLLVLALPLMSAGLTALYQIIFRYGALSAEGYDSAGQNYERLYSDLNEIRRYYEYWQREAEGEVLPYGEREAMKNAPDVCREAEDTNLLYAVVNAQGEVLLSNLKGEDPLAELQELTGGDVAIQSFTYRVEEDYPKEEQTARLRYLSYGFRTGLPVSDAYAQEWQTAVRYRSYLKPALVFTAVCAGVSLLLFLFLAAVAGKRKGEEAVCLNPFDRIWIEVLLAGWVLMLMLTPDIVFSVWNGAVWKFGFLSLFLYGSLTLALSLIRRLRAHRLYRTSLLRQVLRPFRALGRLIHRSAEHTRMMPRLLLMILSVALFEVFCYGMRYSALFVLLWVAGNIALVLLAIWVAVQYDTLRLATDRMAAGQLGEVVKEKEVPFFREMARNLNSAGRVLTAAVEDATRSERMKTELITNVSHDIKTPLTSIINYVDLLHTTEVHDPRALEYIAVLERKSRRLAQLMADLVEASKVTSGNITVELETLNLGELLKQAAGEFEARLADGGIALVISAPEIPLYVTADGRHMWRVLDNLFGNAAKYALEGTRVYVDLIDDGARALLSVKNISRDPLNIRPEELMERFVCGDQARNTDGSGLGLSIARSLMEHQQGSMSISIDGDLFKVTLALRTAPPVKMTQELSPNSNGPDQGE